MKKTSGMVSLNETLQSGGTIKRRKISEKLYVDFYYFGIRITKSTGLDDTPQNRAKVRSFLDKSMQKIEARTFRFADAFPGASRKEKKLFTELEGQQFSPEPQYVIFGEYAKEWMKKVIPTFESTTKRNDYESALNSRILPYFRKKNFYQITSMELQNFAASLKKKTGKNKGKPLARQRMQNIIIPLRRIWEDAADQHRWNLRNPFETLSKHLPSKSRKRNGKVFRFTEWQNFIACAPLFFRPHLEFLLMTGLSASELAGLRKEDVSDKAITLNRSIVLGEEKDRLKNDYRFRRIPATDAIKNVVSRIQALCPDSPYLFPMENGRPFDGNSFRKIVWNKALNESQIAYKTPYSTRHTFCAWALTIGLNPMKLVNLMGHSSKQMVYQVYGEYVEDLEDDVDDIIGYFGKDFLIKPGKKISPILLYGDSVGTVATYLQKS
ncbi:MAG: tyrosine-type recombinase/integrase [Desulfuromonadaceae bacterium]|nr:tyrosine-type recombinase/integrase [Desulfuromonadaceae bacterium]MDD2854766.1 tyrosine-type recombinase/integrase [Desulfuromonadaceae bacterium]